jgi:plastocyanin
MTRAASIALLACLAVLASCGDDAPTTRPQQPPRDLRGMTAVRVEAVADNLFTPDDIVIDAGTRVTWDNVDSIAHNVKKSADIVDFGAPFGVDAGAFGPGATYSFTFDQAGDYFYTCTLHVGMDGRVHVADKPPGPSTSTTTP